MESPVSVSLILLSQIGLLFAAVTELGFIDEYTGATRQCNDVSQPYVFCPQEVYTFTCAVEGNALTWNILDNGTAIPNQFVDYTSVSSLNDPFEIAGSSFSFVLTDNTNGLTSVANVTTQDSTIVGGNGLMCVDVILGGSQICEFSINNELTCDNITALYSNDIIRYIWNGSDCATSYHVVIIENDEEKVSDPVSNNTYDYQVGCTCNALCTIEIFVTPMDLLHTVGMKCSSGFLLGCTDETIITKFITITRPSIMTTIMPTSNSSNGDDDLFRYLFGASVVLNVSLTCAIVSINVVCVVKIYRAKKSVTVDANFEIDVNVEDTHKGDTHIISKEESDDEHKL